MLRKLDHRHRQTKSKMQGKHACRTLWQHVCRQGMSSSLCAFNDFSFLDHLSARLCGAPSQVYLVLTIIAHLKCRFLSHRPKIARDLFVPFITARKRAANMMRSAKVRNLEDIRTVMHVQSAKMRCSNLTGLVSSCLVPSVTSTNEQMLLQCLPTLARTESRQCTRRRKANSAVWQLRPRFRVCRRSWPTLRCPFRQTQQLVRHGVRCRGFVIIAPHQSMICVGPRSATMFWISCLSSGEETCETP